MSSTRTIRSLLSIAGDARRRARNQRTIWHEIETVVRPDRSRVIALRCTDLSNPLWHRSSDRLVYLLRAA